MAGVAGRRQIQRDVARIVRALVILEVTGHASCAVQSVVAAHVTIGALARRNSVHPSQYEAGGGMVEFTVAPLHSVMALFARGREAGVRHRAGRAGEILLVTSNACATAQIVIIVDVAVRALAGRNRVSASQKESSRAVVELGIQPVVGRVARLAGNRELGGNVVWVRSLQKVGLVAGVARGRQCLELAGGAPFVTGIAVDRSVSTGQRETIVVLLNILDCNRPSADAMALLAVGS